MKHGRLIFILGAVLLVPGLYFTTAVREQGNASAGGPPGTAVSENAAGVSPLQPGRSGGLLPENSKPRPVGEERLKRLGEDIYYDYKTPIDFHGVVLDERRAPVAQAEVTVSWEEFSPENLVATNLTSDAKGRFHFGERRGKTILVRVSKKGYYTSARNPSVFEFGNPYKTNFHRPNPAAPVLFRLRRHGLPAPLLFHRLGLELASGQSKTLNLVERGKTGGTVDLTLRAERLRKNGVGKSDWSVEWVAEGLLDSTEEFMFLAPQGGYQDTLVYRLDGEAAASSGLARHHFYFRGRRGSLHGRVDARIGITRQGTLGVALEYYLNTNGSRILEPKP